VTPSADCYSCAQEAVTGKLPQSLGIWQVRLSQALHQVVGCQKTYIAQFAEAEGFAHVHFHIIPRSPDLAEELRGPRIFQMMRADEDALVTEQRRDQIARELGDYLTRPASASPPARNTTATQRASARRPWL
jgi:hypothetical protein